MPAKGASGSATRRKNGTKAGNAVKKAAKSTKISKNSVGIDKERCECPKTLSEDVLQEHFDGDFVRKRGENGKIPFKINENINKTVEIQSLLSLPSTEVRVQNYMEKIFVVNMDKITESDSDVEEPMEVDENPKNGTKNGLESSKSSSSSPLKIQPSSLKGFTIPKQVLAKNDFNCDKEVSSQECVPSPKKKLPDFKPIFDCKIRCDYDNVLKFDKPMKCMCKHTDKEKLDGLACLEDSCLNRGTATECPERCQRIGKSEYCRNRRFQNREYPLIEPFEAGAKGWGIKALEYIKKGTFIVEYVGEIVDAHQCRRRARKYAKDPNHKHHYLMSLTNDTFIDATRKGNISRFVNHSCDPNSKIEKWLINRRTRIGFFAIKDIAVDEEIVFDYNFERFGKKAQKCYCGSSNCRGYISGKKPTDNEDIIDDDGETEEFSDEEEEEESESESSDEEEIEEPKTVPPPTVKADSIQLPPKVSSVVTRARLAEERAHNQERRILDQFNSWIANGQIYRNLEHFKKRIVDLNWRESAKHCLEIINDFDEPTIKMFAERGAMDTIWYLSTTYFENNVCFANFHMVKMVIDILHRIQLKSQQQVKSSFHKLMSEFKKALNEFSSVCYDESEDPLPKSDGINEIMNDIVTMIVKDPAAVEVAVTLQERIKELYDKWAELPEMEYRIPKKLKSAKPGKVSKWEPAPLEAPPKEVPSSEPPIILATLTDHQIKKEAVVPNIHTLSTGGLQPTYMNLPNAETIYMHPYMPGMYAMPFHYPGPPMGPNVPRFVPSLPPAGISHHPAFMVPPPAISTIEQVTHIPPPTLVTPKLHRPPSIRESISIANIPLPESIPLPSEPPKTQLTDDVSQHLQRLLSPFMSSERIPDVISDMQKQFNITRKSDGKTNQPLHDNSQFALPVPSGTPTTPTVQNRPNTGQKWIIPSKEPEQTLRYDLRLSLTSKTQLSDTKVSGTKKHVHCNIPVPPLPPPTTDQTSVIEYADSLKNYRNQLDRHIDSLSKMLK